MTELLTEAAREIDRRGRLFERNFAARDVERLVDDYFLEDAGGPMLVPPGGRPPVRGRAALKAEFAGLLEVFAAIVIETLEVETGEDLASELGRVRLTLREGEGVEVGRFTVLWRRAADGWRAKMDFFAGDAWPD